MPADGHSSDYARVERQDHDRDTEPHPRRGRRAFHHGIRQLRLEEGGLRAPTSSTTARTPWRWPSENNYDLFVLDIMLPGMDGYELCRRLRSKTHRARAVPLGARHRAGQGGRAWRSAATTTSPSPSACASSSPASARFCAAARAASSAGASHAITASGITLDEDAHTATGDARRDRPDAPRVRASGLRL